MPAVWGLFLHMFCDFNVKNGNCNDTSTHVIFLLCGDML
jgi:hypothetical protein